MPIPRAAPESPATKRLRAWPILAAVIAVVLIAAALVLLARADAEVQVAETWLGPTPVRVFQSSTGNGGPAPVVVIAHGFAGSQQLMQPFATTLARNGYVAVTFDFLGHGRNLQPLGGDVTKVEGSTRLLLGQLRIVADHALSLPGAGDGLALLGHSMASDVVVRYAQSDPRVDATVAVSMFSPAVTPDSPGNLLVIVGGLEGFLQQEALRVLGMVADEPRAGVTYGDVDDGTGRRAVFAPGVEHVGVLYSRDSMRAALDWLDRVYDRQDGGYVDNRGWAIILLILGILVLGWPLSFLLPRVSRPARGAAFGWRGLLPAALIPAVVTPLSLWWFPADFLSVLVGGYLAVHFGVYGLATAACLWWLARHEPTSAPAAGPRETRWLAGLAATLLATAYVAGVVGLALDSYVTSFAITPPRLPLALAMLLGTLCYFVADEWLTRGPGTPRAAHVVTRACFLSSLALAVALSFEDLFFLLIIAAVILLYFVVYGLFSGWIYRATGQPLVGAVANAVAFAWALAVVFPMLSG